MQLCTCKSTFFARAVQLDHQFQLRLTHLTSPILKNVKSICRALHIGPSTKSKKHKSAPLMENPEPKAGDPLDGELPTHGQAS